VSVGEPLANAGIIAAERTASLDEGRGAVSLALGNYSTSPARRRLSVTVPGQTDTNVLTREIDVPPGLSSLALPLPAGLPAVHVFLSGDALMRDNDVMLAEPRARIVGVDNQLREGRGRQALIKALDALSGVTRAESAHLLFADASAVDAPQPPGVWRAAFGRAPAAWRAFDRVSAVKSHLFFSSSVSSSPTIIWRINWPSSMFH
jgi:hypothetical protein